MEAITRYEIASDFCTGGGAYMNESGNGEYITYADHLAAITALREALQPWLGNPACKHDKLIYKHQGRLDHGIASYDSCAECGAHLGIVAAISGATK